MEQFLQSPKTKKTVINGLVLFEQRVNLLNVPLILMQLLWILASDNNRHNRFNYKTHSTC